MAVFSPLRRHIGSAHVIALIALFVALGGGAYAAFKLPKNSVGTEQLKRGAVTSSKLSRKTIVELGRALRPRSSVGQPGPGGAPGHKGDTGATGPVGPSDVYAAGAAVGSLTSSYTEVASVMVPVGDYLLQAKTTIFAGPSEEAIASCQIAPTAAGGPGTWDQTRVTMPLISGQTTSQDAALAGAASFGSAQMIVLSCRVEDGSASFDDARVWAIKAGAVHGIPLPID